MTQDAGMRSIVCVPIYCLCSNYTVCVPRVLVVFQVSCLCQIYCLCSKCTICVPSVLFVFRMSCIVLSVLFCVPSVLFVFQM